MRDEEALEKFKKFVLKQEKLKAIANSLPNGTPEWNDACDVCIDPSDEQDWFSLSLGFFCAIGCTTSQAHNLALKARYDHHYWC